MLRGFASLPVGELALRARVSKPTVVRFCRSVGYDGLADFKRKLAGSVNEGVPFVHRAVNDDDKAGDIVVKVIDNAVSAMLKYRNAAAGHAFERAIEALAEAGRRRPAHRVLRRRQFRHRGAGRAAQVLPPRRQLRIAISDGHVQVMSATMLKAGDVRGDHQQLRPQPRPAGRVRDRAAQGRARSSSSAPAARPWPCRRRGPTASCWPPTTPKTTTATARWCRACCTC